MAEEHQPPRASLDVNNRSPGMPIGFNFQPDGRCLVANFLAPKALRGRVPEEVIHDNVSDGVDVYGTRPEALPFRHYNRGEYGKVWGHFFTTRPAAAASGGGGDARCVPGGFWSRYGHDKAYASEDGDVVAFRSRFAFYDYDEKDNGKLTPWRMKEFRLNEGAAAFRGVAFHPIGKDLVVWKVYNEVEIPEEEPPVDYVSGDDGENGLEEAGEIAAEDLVDVADVAAAYLYMVQQLQQPQQ